MNVPHYLYEDGIEISGVKEIFPSDQPIDSFGDHRIAMSFLISSLVSSKDIKVMNCENIYTSFPSFFDEMNKLGLNHGEIWIKLLPSMAHLHLGRVH